MLKVVEPATISLREYVDFFLKTSTTDADASRIIVKCDLVYDGQLRFSKVLRGGENKGENAELQLAKDLKTLLGGDKSWPKRDCSVSVIVNKSLSIISAEQFTQVFRQLRSKVGQAVTFRVAYAHPCHYVNQRALTNLHRAGIKLQVLTVEDILKEIIQDCISDVRGLAKLNIEKIRGVAISIDTVLINAASFMLFNSFQINSSSFVEHITKASYTKDQYVTNLRKEMKKILRSSSKSRGEKKVQKQQVVFNDSENDKESDVVNSTCSEKDCAKTNLSDLLQVGTGTSANEAFVKTRFQLTAAELNNPEECLEFQTHQDLFLVSGGTTKVMKPMSPDGRWSIECKDAQGTLIVRHSGLTYKGGPGSQGFTLSGQELRLEIEKSVKAYSRDELKITSEIHLIVASLPDKNNNVKHVMELAGDLAAKHSGRIQVTVWCAGVENMNVPAMQTLTRMFHEVETSTCQVRKSVRVLHTCDILNFMVDDLHAMFTHLHLVEPRRGLKVRVQPNELTTAMHLIRNAIQVVSTTEGCFAHRYQLPDHVAHERLPDILYQAKTQQLTKYLTCDARNDRRKQ